MAKPELPRKTRENDWQWPSGKSPARRAPVSFHAALSRALKGVSGAGSRWKAHVDTPRPSADSRRVIVKVRIAQLGSAWARKAAQLHLSYLERDGVERDGGHGALYGANGGVERADFERELPGEQHQFRIVVSPEDAGELDLRAYVRSYLQRLEKDLGRKLLWAAVNHYNTDNPHAHLLVRGLDAAGREVRLDREYVSHGLRHRAEELATQELGPRPEWRRREQLRREAELERYTSLDRAIERRASRGVFEARSGKAKDAGYERALRARLGVLEGLGLAAQVRRNAWQLNPRLRAELERLARRAEGLRAIGAVLAMSPARCRVIDVEEPRDGQRHELERGVHGILRWKGLDEQGRFCVVLETTGGAAYHLPVSDRIASAARVGQALELKRAIDKDQQIEEKARQQGWRYDVAALPEAFQDAFRRRLEQLERMQLAERESAEVWRLRSDFRAEVARGKPQPYWQMLSLRAEPQPLAQQVGFCGQVWLDRVRRDEVADSGFGREVRNALGLRYEYLRGARTRPGR